MDTATAQDTTVRDAVEEHFLGENLSIPERVVVSPTLGVFQPARVDVVTTEGEIVHAGQTVGTIEASGASIPVVSPFTGFLMGMLAEDGDRVRAGQPVAWLRVVEG